MNDWPLVSAFVQGDEHAFERLLEMYFPLVYSAAVRQVTDRGLAEEIAQSVFILFSRKAARLSPDVAMAGWLLRTTRFVSRDALKQMKRRQLREQKAAEWTALLQEGDPGWAPLAPLVDEALLALSGQEQACVVARFIQGHSFREISGQLNITEDTAQKRVSRSLDKMRAYLERRGLATATTSIASLLAVDFARSAGPELARTALSAVKAAAAGKATGSLALADSAARLLARRTMAAGLVSTGLGLALIVVGTFAVRLWISPARLTSPASAPFQVQDNRMNALGLAWSRAAVTAAQLIRSYPQGPPLAGDPRAAAYARESALLSGESERILQELGVVLAGQTETAQRRALAEILTVELRENLALDASQQAAVFALIQTEFMRGAASQRRVGDLQQNRASIGPILQRWLTAPQRDRFAYIYGADYRGLFALLLLVE